MPGKPILDLEEWMREHAGELEARSLRIEKLNALWQEATADEILEDLHFGIQMAMFKTYQMRKPSLIGNLRAEIAKGATHDCGEWQHGGTCLLCDGKSNEEGWQSPALHQLAKLWSR